MKAYGALFAFAILIGATAFDPEALPPARAFQGAAGATTQASVGSGSGFGFGFSLEDADWAAVTAIEEAPPEGRAAVVWTIRRRMTACGCRAADVVRASMQFQPWRERRKARRMLRQLKTPNRETMRTAVIAAQVFGGRRADPTGGATHFHAVWDAPYWAETMLETVELGGNVFYRSVRR